MERTALHFAKLALSLGCLAAYTGSSLSSAPEGASL